MISLDNFTRINNTINGNPRYVFHFMDILSEDEKTQIRKDARPMQWVNDCYQYAINKAKNLDACQKYRGKWFGGGIVICSYNLNDFVNKVNQTLNN